MGNKIFTVYILRSLSSPTETYIGMTTNLAKRLSDHNCGHSAYTSRFTPWELVVSVNFPDKYQALEFETYLKSGSDRAFAKKHFH